MQKHEPVGQRIAILTINAAVLEERIERVDDDHESIIFAAHIRGVLTRCNRKVGDRFCGHLRLTVR